MSPDPNDADYLRGLGMPLDPSEPPSSTGDKIAGLGTAIIGLLLAGELLFGQMLDDVPTETISLWVSDVSAYFRGILS